MEGKANLYSLSESNAVFKNKSKKSKVLATDENPKKGSDTTCYGYS